jgi:hypothetical protein
VYLKGLHSPFGMALVGNDLYVADTDAVLRFPYREGAACFVEARDAREARSVADGHFLVPVWPDGAVGDLTSPWRQESLVLVEERMEGASPDSRKTDHNRLEKIHGTSRYD